MSVLDAYEDRRELLSCQGQALSGYDALSEFVAIAKAAREQVTTVPPPLANAIPDLLDALIDASAILDNWQAFAKHPDPSRLTAICMNARAAIAKAIGG